MDPRALGPPNQDPNEVFDRIDIVYHHGPGVVPLDADLVGYPDGGPDTDIPVPGYNADHRAVVATYALPFSVPIFGDFNGDDLITPADWVVLHTNQNADLSGLTLQEAWSRGDLNSDHRNDHADFVIFKQAFDQSHGEGALAALLAKVPEPSTWILFAAIVPTLLRRKRKAARGSLN